MINYLYLTQNGTLTGTTIYIRLDQGVMAMKTYFTFLKAPGLDPHHQIV